MNTKKVLTPVNLKKTASTTDNSGYYSSSGAVNRLFDFGGGATNNYYCSEFPNFRGQAS